MCSMGHSRISQLAPESLISERTSKLLIGNVDPLVFYKPPPLNGDYNRDPDIKTLKSRGGCSSWVYIISVEARACQS